MNGGKGKNSLNQGPKAQNRRPISSLSHTNEWGNLSNSSPKSSKQETDFLPLPYKLMLN